MPHILKNKQLELHIDLPNENYTGTRFDYTAKIVKLIYQDISFTTSESLDKTKDAVLGKGFYNEFGIDEPFNFAQTPIKDWFHKIGVGLLKKTEDAYFFHKIYKKKTFPFTVLYTDNKLVTECVSPNLEGYAYKLIKEIEIFESSFKINYYLENTGEKDIVTTEYVHNFLAINRDKIGTHYILKFPFKIKPEFFGETVNPEDKVVIGDNTISFKNTPNKDFFFSNLSGHKWVKAQWELINTKHNVGIRETGSFKTNKVNLWGLQHVICPELFYDINLKPKTSQTWSRTYRIFKI